LISIIALPLSQATFTVSAAFLCDDYHRDYSSGLVCQELFSSGRSFLQGHTQQVLNVGQASMIQRLLFDALQ